MKKKETRPTRKSMYKKIAELTKKLDKVNAQQADNEIFINQVVARFELIKKSCTVVYV